jgi:hypothetical protein
MTRLCALFTVMLVALVALPPFASAAPTDTDGDTISDTDEGAPGKDTDWDGTPDYKDLDADGDGIPDSVEAGDADLSTKPVDTDKDGSPDFQDVDSDDDKVPDAVEDANGNGKVDDGETDSKSADTDKDGLKDGEEDKNGDGAVDPGECDPLDKDTDKDKIEDGKDACCAKAEDFDGLKDTDGCPEVDADADGVPDTVELGHACLKPLIPDTDADGLKDGQEDKDGDGVVDKGETDPCNKDTDGDLITDGNDKCPLEPEDYDGVMDRDGCPEVNTDGGLDAGVDGMVIKPMDTDGDLLPDSLELTMCTSVDNPDTDGDGRWDGTEDANQNGRVDSGETDPCIPNVRPFGGAGCAVGGAAGPWALVLLVLLLGCMLIWRSRRR